MPEATTQDQNPGAATTEGRKGLFRHRSRPQWGFAILAWSEGDKRGYQFDDGELRVFKSGYFHLLEPAQTAGIAEAAIVSDLEATRSGGAAQRAPLEPEYPFETQVEIFRKLYPGGFSGTVWQQSHRGLVDGRRLKRHVGLAALDAGERLSKSALDERLEAEEHEQVVRIMISVLQSTGLVSASVVQALGKMDPDLYPTISVTLRELLHGDGGFGSRFAAWVAAVADARGKRPSWQLATSLPALVFPKDHICVRPSVMLKQAAVFLPAATYTKTPRRSSYANYLKVAESTRDHLLSAGLDPQDLLDIHEFVQLTLRPKAVERSE